MTREYWAGWGRRLKKGSIYLGTAVLIGIAVGVVIGIFGRVLILVNVLRDAHYYYFAPFLPLAGLLIVFLYKKFNKSSLQGMELIFDEFHKEHGHLPMPMAPLIIGTTWITHLFGGSAGREGAAIQIGAAIGDMIEKYLHVPVSKKLILISGMAAGFGALFQTPLTAAFFAMELITPGILEYDAMIPAVAAAYIGRFIAWVFGIRGDFFTIAMNVDLAGINILKILVLGIAFGFAGRLFAFTMQQSRKWLGKLIPNPYWRIFILSIPLAGLMMLFAGRYAGAGSNLIALAYEDGTIYPWDWILKIIFTALTLGIGFKGGEVAPLFTVGATLGCVMAPFLGLTGKCAAALGYAAVFASGTNTLIAPILICAEAFGAKNIVPSALICIIAYIINGNKSIYPMQKIFVHKLW